MCTAQGSSALKQETSDDCPGTGALETLDTEGRVLKVPFVENTQNRQTSLERVQNGDVSNAQGLEEAGGVGSDRDASLGAPEGKAGAQGCD